MPGKTASRRRARRTAIAAALALLAALAAAPSASAVGSDVAIANLNAQRSTNKIPAGILNDPLLASGCQQHNSWMALNNVLSHEEPAGSPGFTTAGQTAGRTSVLARGTPPWSNPDSNPWEAAPIHLAQILDPALAVSGFDESQGFACLVTLAPPLRTGGAPQIFTYPGPGTSIYGRLKANESPFTPGDLVGIPQPTETGPYLYVFVFGNNVQGLQQAQITSGTLHKKRGKKFSKKVRLTRIDGTNPQLGPFIPPGGMLIPRTPLSPGSYRAAVSVSVTGQTLKKTWKFRAK